MDNFENTVKTIGMKVVKAVGSAATSVAASANRKVDQLNLRTRRSEIMSELGQKCYEIWKEGGQFPEAINNLLCELAEVDDKLSAFAPVPSEQTQPQEEKQAEEVKTVEEIAEAIDETSEAAQEIAEAAEEIEKAAEEICEESCDEEESTAQIPVIKVETEKNSEE